MRLQAAIKNCELHLVQMYESIIRFMDGVMLVCDDVRKLCCTRTSGRSAPLVLVPVPPNISHNPPC